MKSKRFYCKDCNKFFDEPMFYEERHGLDNPPYERIAVCARCGGDNFMRHNSFIEKIEVAEKILPAIMHLNLFIDALRDIFGNKIDNLDLNNASALMVEAISEMFDYLDNDVERQIIDMCSEGELKRILIRLKG